MKTFFKFIFLFFIPNAILAQMPTSGLVAWYPFCGNADDGSGNSYHLHNSSAVLTTDRFGSPNCAYHFDGVNSELYRNPPLPTDGGNFTYSSWFMLDTTGNTLIVENGDNNIDGYEMVITGPVIYTISNYAAVNFGYVGLYLPTSVTMHEWHQSVLRRTAANTFDFIIDTVLVGTITATFRPTMSTEDFAVGRDYTDGTNPFRGSIDDIAVYNRALSDSEIRMLYHYNPSCAVVREGREPMALSPNPVKDFVDVKTTGNLQSGKIVVCNAMGLPVMETPITGESVKLDVSSLSSGIYLVQVFENGHRATTLRLMKE